MQAQDPPGPLRLAFECTLGSRAAFRFTIRNTGSDPEAVVIGSILGNGTHLLHLLELTVSRPGIPDRTLTYVDPTGGVVGGRLDPWLVTLPPRAAYSLEVPPANFRLMPDLTGEPFSTPAGLQLRLTTREIGRPNLDARYLDLLHVWIGTLTSERIDFPGQCGRGR